MFVLGLFIGAAIGIFLVGISNINRVDEDLKEAYERGRADERKDILEKVHTMYNVPDSDAK